MKPTGTLGARARQRPTGCQKSKRGESDSTQKDDLHPADGIGKSWAKRCEAVANESQGQLSGDPPSCIGFRGGRLPERTINRCAQTRRKRQPTFHTDVSRRADLPESFADAATRR